MANTKQNELIQEDTTISENEEEDLPILSPEEFEEEEKFQIQLEKNKYLG